VSAGVRAGKVWVTPRGIAFDGAAARAAAGKAQPGLLWDPIDALPAGAEPLRAPRVGLYKPWAANMDEGWTRFVLEQHGFEPKTLDNKTIRAGNLAAAFDAIVLPDVAKEIIATGRPRREEGASAYFAELPAEYAGGLDKEGAAALRDFVKSGGTLVALSAATEYAIDELALPVRNAIGRPRVEEFQVPGSLLNVEVAPGHPVTLGLPRQVVVFQDKPLAFETSIPGAEMQRWVLASYPEDRRDVLASGYAMGEERLARKAAAVAFTSGKGKVVLLGFRPQHRAQTPGTFPFLFNALWWSVRAASPTP
jgi:hypothetical protein